MRILYFHQYFCTPEGNSGIRSYEMARHLVENGHRVTMVFGESPRLKSPLIDIPYKKGTRRGKYEGIDLIEFDLHYNNRMGLIRRSIVFLKYSLRSIRLIFKEDFDLAFATSTPITTGIPGIIMKSFGRKKSFVFEVRDLWPELPREMGVIKNKFTLWALEILESLSYNKADACVALSPGIEKGIRKKLKTNKPVYLIPNGCDLELFKPGHHPKTIFPGCNSNNFIAVFIGAHGIANGLDAALDAAGALKRERNSSHIKIVLIGDGMIKPHLVKRAREENLDNVIFLDPVPKKHLLNYLWAADAGLMLLANIPAFYYGTSPNKFFDYISSGLPVLNNYPGWLAEMITENNLGVAVKPDNAKDFADALMAMSADRPGLEIMRRNVRTFAENQFDRKKLAIALENAFVTTLDNKKNQIIETSEPLTLKSVKSKL
jgi:glycosyltransferase involved in cell wall biosynthesis